MKPSRAQLLDIAERANVLSHVVGQYLNGMFAFKEFDKRARKETQNLRRELNAAGFGIDERGEPFEPEE